MVNDEELERIQKKHNKRIRKRYLKAKNNEELRCSYFEPRNFHGVSGLPILHRTKKHPKIGKMVGQV